MGARRLVGGGGMRGVCWGVLGTASATLRGAWLHGLQFKAEGREALTATSSSWAAPPYAYV